MQRTAPDQWRNVPGNPYLCPIDARMLLPEGYTKKRLFRGTERFTAYDRSYVIAKLTHDLKALRGLKKRIWDEILNEVAQQLEVDESE